jgi:hypothetical protein
MDHHLCEPEIKRQYVNAASKYISVDLDSLIDRFKCSLCKFSMYNSVTTCSQNHSFCLSCARNNNICPMKDCNSPHFHNNSEMNRFANEIFSNSPIYECCYKGCKLQITPNSYKEHLDACLYKEYQSPTNNFISYPNPEQFKNLITISHYNLNDYQYSGLSNDIKNMSTNYAHIFFPFLDLLIHVALRKFGENNISYSVLWQSKTKYKNTLTINTEIDYQLPQLPSNKLNKNIIDKTSFTSRGINLDNFIHNTETLKSSVYFTRIPIFTTSKETPVSMITFRFTFQ